MQQLETFPSANRYCICKTAVTVITKIWSHNIVLIQAEGRPRQCAESIGKAARLYIRLKK